VLQTKEKPASFERFFSLFLFARSRTMSQDEKQQPEQQQDTPLPKKRKHKECSLIALLYDDEGDDAAVYLIPQKEMSQTLNEFVDALSNQEYNQDTNEEDPNKTHRKTKSSILSYFNNDFERDYFMYKIGYREQTGRLSCPVLIVEQITLNMCDL